MTWLNVLGIFMMTIGVIILSADMVVRLVTVCRDWYYNRKTRGLDNETARYRSERR